MHASILSKCIEELKAETPDISYIRGALETLLAVSASDPTRLPIVHQTYDISRTVPESEPVVDPQEAAAAAYLRGPTGTVA